MLRLIPLFVVAVLGPTIPSAVVGQVVRADSAPPGAVVGTVVDAGTSERLRGAVVTLERRAAGDVALRVARSGIWGAGRTAITGSDGRYAFTNIEPGSYRLMVRRLGYRPAVLSLELRRVTPTRVSVGLLVQPVLLEPEEVRAAAAPFARVATIDDDLRGGRLDTELDRQRTYPASDVSVLTQSDLVEAVTLGETDLLRALHRVPGISTRDQYTAELWTRGASWDQTRVSYDGLPVFNPVHAGGVFSALDPAAIGSVVLHPGVRSVTLGEGAAGVVDIGSRPPPRTLSGSAELSVVSARASVGAGSDRGDGFRLAVRRSYIDLVTAFAGDAIGAVPYAFLDLAARGDLHVGRNAVLSASGLWERDDLWGTVRDLLRGSRGHWGNAVGRVALTAPLGPLIGTHAVGASRFAGNIAVAALRPGDGLSVPVHEPTANTISYVRIGSRLEPPSSTWGVGWEIIRQRQSYDGPRPRPYPQAILFDSLRLREGPLIPAAWAEVRPAFGPLRIVAGLRTEFPGRLMNVGPVALAPRVSARWEVGGSTALSAGYGRSFQYAQTIAPAGPGVGPELHLTDVWLMAGDTVPALVSDVFTVGIERWLAQSWLGMVNVYRTEGLAQPAPDPGDLLPTRPVYVMGAGRAAGFEVSARRLSGRWNLWLAYAFGGARIDASTWRYPSSADRRHALDATAMVHVGGSLRIGGGLTVATGAPYTRFILGPVSCDSIVGGCIGVDTVFTTRTVEAPNAERTGTWTGVDLLAEWSRDLGRVRFGAWVQLRNAFDRRNALTYVGSYQACTAGVDDVQVQDVCDRFDRGVPLLPLVGLHVSF